MTNETPNPIDQVVAAIRLLAGMCDGAASYDDVGFNKADSTFGHSLAQQSLRKALSAAQVRAGFKMVTKYHRQLDEAGLTLPQNYELEEALGQRDGVVAQTAAPALDGTIKTNGEVLLVAWPRGVSHDKNYAAIKGIQGAYWDREQVCWQAPLMEVEAVLGSFPTFRVDEGVQTIVAAVKRRKQELAEEEELERQREQMQAEALLGEVGDLNKPLPDGRVLRKHQQEAVLKMIRTPKMILAHAPGLGKTLTTLVAAKTFGLPIIVIAPKSLHENWVREAYAAGVKISVHSWAKIPVPPEWTEYIVVGDESHLCKTYGSYVVDKNTGEEKVKGVKRSADFIRLARHSNARAVFALSGTPMPNGRPAELFPILYALGHDLAKNKRAYEVRYCAAAPSRFNPWDISGAAHLDELFKNIQNILLRKRKRDCIDLPPLEIIQRPVELDGKVETEFVERFQALRNAYFERLESGQIKEGGEALVLLTNLMEASAMAKVNATIDLCQEILGSDAENQVVVFTNSKKAGVWLARELKCEHIDGDAKDRQSIVDRFQSGRHRAIVATYKAAGVGLNLQSGNYVVLNDAPWTPDHVEQARSRIERDGQKRDMTGFDMILPPIEVPGINDPVSIDDKVWPLLRAKEQRIELVLSGKRRTMRGIKDLSDVAEELLADVFGGRS